jgi:serine/threonine protein kinase
LYEYRKFLGCGSFGFVVSAIDRQSGEEVALKVIILEVLKVGVI